MQSLQSTPPNPLPHRTAHPCRKIVFAISSKDQGFSPSRDTGRYAASFTWFDANVIPRNHEAGEDATHTKPAEPKRPLVQGDPLLLPRDNKLQTNVRAGRNFERHTVVWHYMDDIRADSGQAEEIEQRSGRGRATLDGRVVRELEVGDSISVIGRARFGGWSNYVESVSVRVFWAV